MAPLPRLIQAVRDQSNSAEQLLENAFALCEANLTIGREEYGQWQGLCVVDATSVFSVQGLGGDLCSTHGYDFWRFLRAMGDLAKRSHDPAQYHQCINHNLFSSPADDTLILERLQSLQNQGDLRLSGCMVDTAKLLCSLQKPDAATKPQAAQVATEGSILITPRDTPAAFGGYGRSLKLNMDGQVLVRGPYCLNVWLEQPYHWLASIHLEAGLLSAAALELSYQLQLEQAHPGQLKLLLASTASEPAEPGRVERHFWVNRATLPAEAAEGVSVAMGWSHWQPLQGHPREAYGLKCRSADAELIYQRPTQLIVALEARANAPTPTGQMSLPSLKITNQLRTDTSGEEVG
jgi:hypothetical protein